MSPVCQLEMTLPRGFAGGVGGDGSSDERWGAFAAGGPEGLRRAVVAIIRQWYWDFGPTLAAEKLREDHGIALGRLAFLRAERAAPAR